MAAAFPFGPRSMYIAQVGRQPGALATVLATLSATAQIERVLLLASEGGGGTRLQAERICLFLRELRGNATAVEIVTVNVFDPNAVAAVVRERAVGVRPDPVYFDCGPGINFVTACVARQLVDATNVRAVYADDANLWDIRAGRRIPLLDIGLRQILALHGLETRGVPGSGDMLPADDGLLHDAVVAHGSEVLFAARAIYEHCGRLHCLRVHDVPLAKTGKPDRAENLRLARETIAVSQGGLHTRGLRPHVLAVCSTLATRRQLLSASVPCVQLDRVNELERNPDGTLARWFARNPPQPGSGYEYTLDTAAVPPPKVKAAASGTFGPPLLVSLGTDPSAALVAIWTHRPRITCLAYDHQTSSSRVVAQRLVRVADQLPTQELRFLRMGLAGEGADAEFFARLRREFPDLVVNVTPGSKPQAWVMGQAAGFTHCTLRGDDQTVRDLGQGVLKGLAWQTPPTLVQASVCGGDLEAGASIDGSHLDLGFLFLVAKCIRELADRRTGRVQLGQQRGQAALDVLAQTGEDANAQIRVRATLGTDSREGTLPGAINAGFWLEHVAAAAFLQAGAEDMHVGIRWRLDARSAALNPLHFLREIDLAFKWKQRFVVASVKSGQGASTESSNAEIKANAQLAFGRFAIPILVRAIPPGKPTGPMGGALQIGLHTLAEPEQLASLLDRHAERSNTLPATAPI